MNPTKTVNNKYYGCYYDNSSNSSYNSYYNNAHKKPIVMITMGRYYISKVGNYQDCQLLRLAVTLPLMHSTLHFAKASHLHIEPQQFHVCESADGYYLQP